MLGVLKEHQVFKQYTNTKGTEKQTLLIHEIHMGKTSNSKVGNTDLH